MGLDAVEIVMNVEDHFGITIADGEAERIRTVGDLLALIRSRLDAATAADCLALPAFLSLRHVVRDIVGDNRFHVRPSHAVVDRLSPAHRRKLWKRLRELLGTRPPPLRRPKPVRWIQIWFGTLLLVGAIGIAGAVDWAILPTTLLLAGAMILLMNIGSSWLRTEPPDGLRTMGDITRKIVGRTAAVTRLELSDDSALLNEVRRIIVDTLGVDPDDVVPEARLVQDLRMS